MPSKVDTGGGSVITIQGSNFGTSGTVFINSVSCDPSGAGFSHTSITCSVPAGQGSLVSFVVLVSGQNVTNSSFFGYLGPTISSISPSNGPTGGGVPITLSGSSFGLSTSPNLVYVGNSLCPIVPGSYTSARVVCTLPVGALTAYVTLIVVGASNATVQFAYDNPILSSVVPNTGLTQGGISVTISGSSFDSSGTVFIGGNSSANLCNVTSYSHSQVKYLLFCLFIFVAVVVVVVVVKNVFHIM